jgi:hypothetical protein
MIALAVAADGEPDICRRPGHVGVVFEHRSGLDQQRLGFTGASTA